MKVSQKSAPASGRPRKRSELEMAESKLDDYRSSHAALVAEAEAAAKRVLAHERVVSAQEGLVAALLADAEVFEPSKAGGPGAPSEGTTGAILLRYLRSVGSEGATLAEIVAHLVAARKLKRSKNRLKSADWEVYRLRELGYTIRPVGDRLVLVGQ